MKYFVLFNPLAGNGNAIKKSQTISVDSETVYLDVTKIEDYTSLFSSLDSDDKIIICGGDGTLNRFINATENIDLKNDILYVAAGSGNDFIKDIGQENADKPIKVNDYINNLPIITVNGRDYRFINGIGFGIDGYCCEERDRKQAKNNKPVNYTLIALKGLLFAYKPRNATVIIDGKEYKYKKVWMAPTMLGRYFGGGMMVTPQQDRNNPDGMVTSFIAHDLSKALIVYFFPLIFKGKHTNKTKYVAIKRGYDIKVAFDKPCALQIDGETVTNVSEYSVKASKTEKELLTSDI